MSFNRGRQFLIQRLYYNLKTVLLKRFIVVVVYLIIIVSVTEYIAKNLLQRPQNKSVIFFKIC
jgi:hypothetical protein